MKYNIWYMKPEFTRWGMLGYLYLKNQGKLPSPLLPEETHVFVKTLDVPEGQNLDYIFREMQGEVWSPNGEARELIRSKGLDHTSMCIGDMAEDHGVFYMCDITGWMIP